MTNYLATDTDLESVADAIRTKGGTSADLEFPSGFVSAIQAIPTGGGIEYETYIAASEITNISGLVTIVESVFDTSVSSFITMERIPQSFHSWKNDLVMYVRSYKNGVAEGAGTKIFYLGSSNIDIRFGAATPGYESSDTTHVYVGDTLILRQHAF